MRYPIFVLALALVAGTTEARADQIVSYNMTGTVTSQMGYTTGFLVGDHISWRLYLDRSAPMTSSTNTSSSYSLPPSLIPSISGITVPNNLNPGGWVYSLTLSNSPAGKLYAAGGNISTAAGSAALSLEVNGSLPSLNLANLQLNNIPFLLGKGSGSYLSYYHKIYNDTLGFTASVDSISAPVYGAPEPGSLTLFLLGAAGLAAGGIRRRLRRIG